MDDNEALAADQPNGYLTHLTIILSIVNSSENLTLENKSRVQKIHLTFLNDQISFALVLLKFHPSLPSGLSIDIK